MGNVLSRSEAIGGAAAGMNTYAYDALDRVTRIEQSGTGVTAKRVDLEYNALGRFTTITRYADLAGTLGTVFSSLLGVWQAAPYLFADCWRLAVRRSDVPVSTSARPYRAFLIVLALVPMLGLFASFREVQKLYTVIGAYIFPTLALVLIVFNSRSAWVGRFKNRPVTISALAGVLAFFTWLAVANIET